jgi:Straboviridae polynucleotide kinase
METAIIVDIDGTLAHRNDRSPYDYSKVAEDNVDIDVRDLVYVMSEAGTTILLISGREDSCENDTERWLQDNLVPYQELFMRKSGDYRKDSIVKEEIYNQYIKGKYLIRFVLDDRDQVVKMWRGLGLKCLQVAEGAF